MEIKNSKLLLLLALLITSTNSYSQLKKEFSIRYQKTLKGKFTTIGNNTLSEHEIDPVTDSEANNSTIDMVNVKIDDFPDVFNSSSADFENPNLECVRIDKVLLYWSATDVEKEWEQGDPISDKQNQENWEYNHIKLMLPGQTEYKTLIADKSNGEVIFRARDLAEHFSNDPYTCVKDITKEVQDLAAKKGNPYGTYKVANIESSTGYMEDHSRAGTGAAGGWQIVFVYEYLDAPSQQITLYDGYAQIIKKSDSYNVDDNVVNFDIKGFQTVPEGNVNASILFGALEGDSTNKGDQLRIQKKDGSSFVSIGDDKIRFKNNFFNSSITVEDEIFIKREPASTNTLGFDAGIFKLNNTNNEIIGNSQKNATLQIKTNADSYGLYLLGFSIEVFKPDLEPVLLSTKTDVNLPVNPEQVIDYELEFKNNGNDNAENVSLSTTLPSSVTLIQPQNLPNGVSYNYDDTTKKLLFLVDSNLMKTDGELLKIPYSVKVLNNCHFIAKDCSGLTIANQFDVNYTGDLNKTPENTKSSSLIDKCRVGNLLPVYHTIKPENPTWETTSLNRKVACDNEDDLKAAQALKPKLNLNCGNINVTITKIPGEFVPAGNSCASNGSYTNTFVFENLCGTKIDNFIQVIEIYDDVAPTLEDCSGELADLVLQCGTDMQKQADDWHKNNLNIIKGCAKDNCNDVSDNITDDYNFNVSDNPICSLSGEQTEVNYTIGDGCDNTIVKTLKIIYEDTTGPEVDLCNTEIKDETLQCTGVDLEKFIQEWDAKNKTILKGCVKDLCNPDLPVDIISERVGDIEYGCSNTGKVTLRYSALDYCKNKSADSIEVTLEVIDDTLPILTSNLEKVVNVTCAEIPDVPQLTFEDNCSLDAVDVVFEEESTYEDEEGKDFIVTRTWTVTDGCNNTEVFTQTINATSTTFKTDVLDDPCIDNGIIDLNSYLTNTPNDKSEWKFISGPTEIVLKDGTFDPKDIDIDVLELESFKFSYTAAEGLCYRNTLVELNINDDCIVYPCDPESFFISKSITPNGDAFNEYFTVKGSRECEFPVDLKIFNRWGSIIYENANYNNDWNGFTIKSAIGRNEKVTNGTYYYVITLVGSGFNQLAGPLYVGTN